MSKKAEKSQLEACRRTKALLKFPQLDLNNMNAICQIARVGCIACILIGLITINAVAQSNPHFTKTGTATLNGQVGDSITLNGGDNLAGSFPYSVANGNNANAIVIVVVGYVDANNN